jgi:hypothetical protein
MKIWISSACVLLAACVSGRTTIQSSWSDEAYAGPPLDRLAVVALFETRAESLSFERSAAEYLATQGVEIVAGHDLLPPEQAQNFDEQQVRARIAATDVDGLLIVRLIAVDERREYLAPTQYLHGVPPEVSGGDAASWYYRPSSDFYGYWRSSADVTAAPGYWLEQTFLVAETALFDNRSDRLLWTAKSATMDDEHFRRTSESIVRTVARQLFARDLIARMAEPPAPAPGAGRG